MLSIIYRPRFLSPGCVTADNGGFMLGKRIKAKILHDRRKSGTQFKF